MQDQLKLHDIKPLLVVEDYSFYYFIALVTLVSLLLVGGLYLLYRYLKTRKKFNLRKEHFKRLEAVDLSKSKEAAYALTTYGATFQEDSLRHKKTYEDMLERLAAYKYKKEVGAFDAETRRIIELYRGMIDV